MVQDYMMVFNEYYSCYKLLSLNFAFNNLTDVCFLQFTHYFAIMPKRLQYYIGGEQAQMITVLHREGGGEITRPLKVIT